jgi:hypothetical protein
MEYILTVVLTFALSWFILNIGKRSRVKNFGKIVYSQSSIHERVKDFIPRHLYDKPEIETQAMKHVAKHMIKIIVIDNKAYWVKDNIFYVADTQNGNVIPETAQPVDIENMPKKELDKMLFILDNLGKGKKKDDSSSTGNE